MLYSPFSAVALAFMMRVLNESPIKRLYVPASLYAGDAEPTVREHVRMLSQHGTDLVLCDDD